MAWLCLFCYVWGGLTMAVAWVFHAQGRPLWMSLLPVLLPAAAFVYGLSAGA